MMSVYLQGNSWAHRMPAGLKLLAVAVASLLLLRYTSFWILLPALAGVLLCYSSWWSCLQQA